MVIVSGVLVLSFFCLARYYGFRQPKQTRLVETQSAPAHHAEVPNKTELSWEEMRRFMEENRHATEKSPERKFEQ